MAMLTYFMTPVLATATESNPHLSFTELVFTNTTNPVLVKAFFTPILSSGCFPACFTIHNLLLTYWTQDAFEMKRYIIYISKDILKIIQYWNKSLIISLLFKLPSLCRWLVYHIYRIYQTVLHDAFLFEMNDIVTSHNSNKLCYNLATFTRAWKFHTCIEFILRIWVWFSVSIFCGDTCIMVRKCFMHMVIWSYNNE